MKSGEQRDLGSKRSMCKGPGVGRSVGGLKKATGQSEVRREHGEGPGSSQTLLGSHCLGQQGPVYSRLPD